MPDRDKEHERTALYREGVALAEAGRWDEALKRFEKVVAIRSAPPALVALATAQEKAGKIASAKHTFQKAQADALAAGDVELAQKAEKALTALDPRVARIVVRLPPGTSGARVLVDGNAIAADPKGVEADPGEHQVVVEVPGQPIFQERVVLAAEQRKEIAVRLGARGPADAPAAQSAPDTAGASGDSSSGGPPIGSWILGGAGVAASIVGLVVRFDSQASYDDVSAQCPNEQCRSQAEAEEANAARSRMLAGSIVAGAGVGLMASAGLWWVLSSRSPQPDGRNTPVARISAAPTPLYGGPGIVLRGTF